MRKSVWLVSTGMLAIATPALAQRTDTNQAAAIPTDGATAEAAAVNDQAVETQTAVGDIIVTATRRNEALSDIPLAVSAVTAETLQNTGASDIRQMQQVSPSLLVTSTQSEAGASTARIRGIGTVGDNPGLESSVGIFIDGVYRSRTGAGLTELGPVDRIEVLRGPQGTLFGRNTSAGLISIITAKPRFKTEAYGELTVGNYDLRRVELGATGPVSSILAARIDGVYLTRDGFLEDIVSGRDVNDRNRWLLRGQLFYQPHDDLSVRLSADYSRRDEECCAAPYLPTSDAVRGPTGVSRGPSSFEPFVNALAGRADAVPDDPFKREVTISDGRSYRGDVKDWGLSGEAIYDLGGTELTSITAYRDNDLIRGTDTDYSILDLIYRPSDGRVFNRFKTFTQELRVQGEAFGGKLDWLVGGYYANEKLRSQDSLLYGRDYDRLANCLVANSFANAIRPLNPGAAAALVTPGSATCFNPAVAGLVFPAIPPSRQTAFAAFARLGVFATPGFTNSGFENLALASPALPDFTLNGSGYFDDYRQTSNNFALFTHNIFSITDRLKLTIGARYTSETKKLDADLTDNNLACTGFSGTSLATFPCIVPSIPGASLQLNGKKRENKPSGTIVLSYKVNEELLTYATYSRGYKAGGFNLDRTALTRQTVGGVAGAVCVSAATPGCARAATAEDFEFRPEINDAIELGLKYNGRGIDINVAAFHQLFRDFQLNTFNGINFIVENINSCSKVLGGADTDNNPATGACTGKKRAGVRSMGVEFEMFTRPIPDVYFNFGATFADTAYRRNLVGAGGRALTNALFQLPGQTLSNSAEWTVTSSLAWTPPIGGSGLRGLFYIDMRHQNAFNTGSDLDIEKVENGYILFNGRVGINGSNRAWAVELWAQNLFDEEYKQIAFDAFLQGSGTQRGVEKSFYGSSNQLYGVFLGEPRTYGLTLRGKF